MKKRGILRCFCRPSGEVKLLEIKQRLDTPVLRRLSFHLGAVNCSVTVNASVFYSTKCLCSETQFAFSRLERGGMSTVCEVTLVIVQKKCAESDTKCAEDVKQDL